MNAMSAPNAMKAVRIHGYGNAAVLHFEDAPLPDCLAEDVLIRVLGSSVNPVDWKLREGHLRSMLTPVLPFTLGWDVSGVVHAVGANTTRFKVGDAVYSRPDIARNGCYAEFVAVREVEAAFKPATASHMQAAVLPLAGITAWQAIVTVGQVKPGQRVLIHAGAGGVGSLAVQIAKAHGAFVVATASGRHRSLVESLGADEFIDYQTQRLQGATAEIDLVLDTQGDGTQEASWAVMAPGALLVSIASDPAVGAARRRGLRGQFLFIQPDAAALEKIAQLLDSGKLRTVIGAEFALKDIAAAHNLSQTGHATGKIALYVGKP